MYLYHFTDYRNVNSITQEGLLSWPLIYQLGINAILGSNELSRFLDKRKGLSKYVRLALKPKHPMLGQCLQEGRIARAVWLKIDEAILRQPGVLYSDTNAAANRATINNHPSTAFKGCYDAEILIPKFISSKHILNL
jgi:hypothetical protein